MGASAAFVVGIGVAAVVTMFTTSKPDSELVGLVWALTPRQGRGKVRVAPSASEEVTAGAGAQGETARHHAAIEEVPAAMHEEEGAWWQSPVVMGAIVLALTLVLYLIFA